MIDPVSQRVRQHAPDTNRDRNARCEAAGRGGISEAAAANGPLARSGRIPVNTSSAGPLRREEARGPGRRSLAQAAWLALVLFLPISAAQAQNVSVTDYSVPVSRADNLRIDAFNLNYVTEGNEAVVQSGNLGIVYKKFYESLPFAYSIDFIGSSAFRKDIQTDELVTDYTTDLVTRLKRYPREDRNYFFFGDTDLDFNDQFDRPSIDMTIGLGYGRFINATALRKAVRIEDFFLHEGIIDDHLPKDTMIELGHIIETEEEYKDLYGDRYQNYWFEDMTNEIQKSGQVLGSIGAIGVLRIDEVLFKERINERFYGWEATAGVNFEVLTETENRGRRDPAMSLRFRYSRPVSWSTQINTDFRIDSPFSSDFGRIYNLRQTLDFIYEISNKINFTAAHLFRADKARGSDVKLSTTVSFAFSFFIENKINLTAFEQITTVEGEPFRQSFNVGLSYRIF